VPLPSPGRLVALRRHPVKSLVGEDLTVADIDERGLHGDRAWAVRDEDGRFGSGKTTRRFRQMDGLLRLRSRLEGEVPVVELPDGATYAGPGPDVDAALSRYVGRPVTLAPEGVVSHFDEGPLHLVTTGQLARLGQVHGAPVDVRRLRPNLLVDSGSADPSFDERDWLGRRVRVGTDVVLRPLRPMTRCVMVDLEQADLPAADGLLRTISAANLLFLGLVVEVLRPGRVRVGDEIRVEPGQDFR
jgi:uncharacterized protein YcbX